MSFIIFNVTCFSSVACTITNSPAYLFFVSGKRKLNEERSTATVSQGQQLIKDSRTHGNEKRSVFIQFSSENLTHENDEARISFFECRKEDTSSSQTNPITTSVEISPGKSSLHPLSQKLCLISLLTCPCNLVRAQLCQHVHEAQLLLNILCLFHSLTLCFREKNADRE